jgi:hypothetical protein
MTRQARVKIFFDAEFTSLLLDPHLLSVGLATADGREHYAEIDLHSDLGRACVDMASWDVRENILDKWGVFPDAVCDSVWALGRRVGEWLVEVATSSADGRIELLYDYNVDLELLVGSLEACDLWAQVCPIAGQRNIGAETAGIGAEVTAEATFRALRQRQPPLYRHHALADALALRAAWRTWLLVHKRAPDFARLLRAIDSEVDDRLAARMLKPLRRAFAAGGDAWLYEWLAQPALALGGLVPLDVLDQVDGVQVVVDALARIQGGSA